MKDMRAVIMAGGEGSRLRPMTCTMPKPLVPLLNKPVIDYCIDLLKKHGIEDISTTVYYLGNMISDYIGNGERYGVNITHSTTPMPLGTAGSVRQAIYNAKDGKKTIVVISGDTLTDCNLKDAITFHRQKGAKVTLVLKRVASPTEYGVALLDSESRITRFLEKPDKNEVFSDLANTGIYIIEPEIIDMIPPEKQFDFSCDLFPMLLDSGIGIYGFETIDYWCDIGDIRQYLQAQRDMLDGKVAFETSAVRNGSVFIEDGAKISDNAILRSPCYISSGVEVGERVVVDAYSVIGSDVKLHADTNIKRSVVMRRANIRENAELRGAIVCENAEIDVNSSIFENCVIGERVKIGKNAVVSSGACIWPEKQIDSNMKIDENIVWGVGKRIEYKDTGISGYCDTDISPETAVRIGAAFAKMLPQTAGIAIAGDGKRMSAMLKHAAATGVVSQGVDVYTLPYMPYSVFSYSIRHMGLAGGIFVNSDTDNPHIAHLTVCDETGTVLDTTKRRKLQATFNRGELHPVTKREIGICQEVTGTVKSYEAEMLKSIDTETISKNPSTIVLDVPKSVFEITAPILMRCGWHVEVIDSENGEKMYSEIMANKATIGCFVPKSNENMLPVITLQNGKSLQGMATLAVFASAETNSGAMNRFVLPVTFPDEYSRYLMNKGATIVSAPEEWHMWQKSAFIKGCVVNEFFDPNVAIIKAAELSAKGTLMRYFDELPETYLTEYNLPCSWNDVGHALRSLVESENQADIEPIDGVKIHTDKGWIIVKSANGYAACRIICGSFKEEYANELSGIYIDKLRSILDRK